MNDNKTILRGQIYHVRMDPENMPVGSEMWPERPAIIVSNDVNNQFANTVEVVYLTTKLNKAASPTHVKVFPAKRPSLALCEQICTVDRTRLDGLIDTVDEATMNKIEQALVLSLGIADENKHAAGLFHKWEMYINKYQLQIGMQLKKLFDDQFKPTADPAEIKKLKSQLEKMTQERDMHKSLYQTAQKKLKATEEERDTYERLYQLTQTTEIETAVENN